MKKFYFNKDVNIMLYLSRAYYEAGKMKECKETLQKAIHLAPNNKNIWFNLGLSMEKLAKSACTDRNSRAEIEVAMKEIDGAWRYV